MLHFKLGSSVVIIYEVCFYVCILGFFVHGFPKLLRFQEHHEKILNKFLSKLKQHLVGRYDLDLHPPIPRIKLEDLSAAIGPHYSVGAQSHPFHLPSGYSSQLLK